MASAFYRGVSAPPAGGCFSGGEYGDNEMLRKKLALAFFTFSLTSAMLVLQARGVLQATPPAASSTLGEIV